MLPSELYLINTKLREKLEKLIAEADRNAEAAKKHSERLKGFRELPKEIKRAVDINKSIARRLERKK